MARLQAENKKLRRENRELTKQRDRWRDEARNWQWGSRDRTPGWRYGRDI